MNSGDDEIEIDLASDGDEENLTFVGFVCCDCRAPLHAGNGMLRPDSVHLWRPDSYPGADDEHKRFQAVCLSCFIGTTGQQTHE